MKTMTWGCAAVLVLSSITMTAQDYGEPEPLTGAAVPVASETAMPAISPPAAPVAVALPAPPPSPQAAPKDDLFAGTEKFAKGASDVTDVNLGPDMLGMVSGKHGGDVAHKMDFMTVRTYKYPRTGMYSMEEVDVYRQKLRNGNWNCFIHTYESKTGESTDICNRPAPDHHGNEMVILTVEPKELTFIHMSGTGSLADLSKLGELGGMIPTPPTPPTPPAPPAPPSGAAPQQ